MPRQARYPCRLMGIARSPFYDEPSASHDDTAVVEAIAAICDEFEAYGWRRVRAELRHQRMIVNDKKIRRPMRPGPSAVHRRGLQRTSSPFRSGLSQPATVRGPQPPAYGQISGLILVRPKGPAPASRTRCCVRLYGPLSPYVKRPLSC
jgi:HTH-like domain